MAFPGWTISSPLPRMWSRRRPSLKRVDESAHHLESAPGSFPHRFEVEVHVVVKPQRIADRKAEMLGKSGDPLVDLGEEAAPVLRQQVVMGVQAAADVKVHRCIE